MYKPGRLQEAYSKFLKQGKQLGVRHQDCPWPNIYHDVLQSTFESCIHD